MPISADTTGMEITADGRTIYLADGYNNRVQVIDTSTQTVVGSIPLGPALYSGNPGGIALSPDGKWLYVTTTDDATISVIDTTTRSVVGAPIVVGVSRMVASTISWPTAIAVSPNGSRIYVADGDDIVVIDAATRSLIGAVRFPGAMSDTSARRRRRSLSTPTVTYSRTAVVAARYQCRSVPRVPKRPEIFQADVAGGANGGFETRLVRVV